MGGLARLCKLYGRMEISDGNQFVVWVHDYALDKPRIESDMTQEELMASEKAKWMAIKENL